MVFSLRNVYYYGKDITPIVSLDLQLTQGTRHMLDLEYPNLVYEIRNIYCMRYTTTFLRSIRIKQHG